MPVYGPPARQVLRDTLNIVDINDEKMAFSATTGIPIKLSTTEDPDDPANGVPLPGCIALYAHGNQILARTVEDGPVAEIQVNIPAIVQSSATGDINNARFRAASCVLDDGRVFISGGRNAGGSADVPTCEIFDPSTGVFTPTGDLVSAERAGHQNFLLDDGTVLICGGEAGNDTSELYDPITGECASTGNLNVMRGGAKCVKLNDGCVLLVGGDMTGTAEIYDPATGEWTSTGTMSQGRFNFNLIKLNDGTVLAIGGYGQSDGAANVSCEIYDPNTEVWTLTGSISTPRSNAGASLLADGRVLLTCGADPGDASIVHATCEIFTPGDGTWAAAATASSGHSYHKQVTNNDGTVFILNGVNYVSSAYVLSVIVELYDPTANEWTTQIDLSTARYQPIFEVMDSGLILVASGADNNGGGAASNWSTAEIYGAQSTSPLKTDVGVMMKLRSGVPIPDTSYATVFLSTDGTMKIRKADGSIVDVGGVPADLTVNTITTTGNAIIGGDATVSGANFTANAGTFNNGISVVTSISLFGASPVGQGAAIADPSGGVVQDEEARAAIALILARMRATGDTAT